MTTGHVVTLMVVLVLMVASTMASDFMVQGGVIRRGFVGGAQFAAPKVGVPLQFYTDPPKCFDDGNAGYPREGRLKVIGLKGATLSIPDYEIPVYFCLPPGFDAYGNRIGQ